MNALTSMFAASAVAGQEPRTVSRVGLYVGLSFAFSLSVVTVAMVGGSDNPRILYLCLLFLICASPVAFAGPVNGRYAILAVFVTLYFLLYGLMDLMSLIPALGIRGSGGSQGMLSRAEVAVLVGALLLIAGYAAGVRFTGSKQAQWFVNDWNATALLSVGLALWVIGIAATWFLASEVVDRYVGNVSLGRFEAVGLVAARMVQPLGVALLTYRFVVSDSRRMLPLLLAVLCIEFAFGFIADSKELSVRGMMILFLGFFLLKGRVPKTWAVAAAFAFMLSFAIFHAYRLEVLQIGGQSRAGAAANIADNLNTALSSDTLEGGFLRSGSSGLVGRISIKPTMEMVVARTGVDVAYQGGYTLQLLLNSFIPRIFWPDKPDSSVGQLFNRQFRVSLDPDTYISATHLGELYWNFGWPGLLVGMFAIGLLLGFVNGRIALLERKSATRFLLLVVTIYLLCVRFEGGIALQYSLWMRSVGLIMALHWLLARQAPTVVTVLESQAPQSALGYAANVPLVMTGAELLARIRR